MRMHRWTVWLWVFLGGASALAIPGSVNFQGTLRTNGGVAVPDGPHDVTFFLTATENAPQSAALWTEAHTAAVGNPVQTVKSLFQVTLAVPLSVLVANNTLFLGVNSAGQDMHPRPPIASVPFAFRAAAVESVDGAAGGAISGPVTVTTSAQRAVTAVRSYTGSAVVQPAVKGTNYGSGAGVYGESLYMGADMNTAGVHGYRTGAGGAAVLAETDNAGTPAVVTAGPGNFLEGRPTKDAPPAFWVDHAGSITVEHGAGATQPPLLYAEGLTGDAGNNSRYWIAHSRQYPNYGLFYNDVTDGLEFHSAGSPKASVNLLSGDAVFGNVTSSGLSSPYANIGSLATSDFATNTIATKDLTVSGTLNSNQLPRIKSTESVGLSVVGSDTSTHALATLTVKPPGSGRLWVFGTSDVAVGTDGQAALGLYKDGYYIGETHLETSFSLGHAIIEAPMTIDTEFGVTTANAVTMALMGNQVSPTSDGTRFARCTLTVMFLPDLPF